MLLGMRSLRSLASGFLLLAAAMLCAAQTPAEPPRIWRICVGDQPVVPYLNNDPRHLGRAERLLVAAGRTVELSVLLQRYPARRCRAMVLSGDSDMTLAAPTPDNLQEFMFPMKAGAPDPDVRLARLNLVWARRQDGKLDWDGKRFTGLTEGQTPRVGVRAGQRVALHAVQMLPVLVDETALSTKLLLRMLNAGRFDLALGLQDEFELALADPEIKPLVVLPKAMLREDFYAVISHKHVSTTQPLAERFWAAIARMRDLPEFQRD